MKKTIQNKLNQDFWNQRWENNLTGWDIGYASPAITDFMMNFPNKSAKILIPGCGNAYEAEFLVEHGFTTITLLDIAPKAVERLNEKFKNLMNVRILCEDFFQHQEKYDLIIEQTFFCAISPEKREKYAQKANELLNENGKIIGVLFSREFEKQGPPFGGNKTEYIPLFEPFFTVEKMENCYNSIEPRKNSELFIHLSKK